MTDDVYYDFRDEGDHDDDYYENDDHKGDNH